MNGTTRASKSGAHVRRLVRSGRTRRFGSLVLLVSLIAPTIAPLAQTLPLDPTMPSSATPMLVFTIDVRQLGVSAYRLERDVTIRIEDAVKTLPGVRRVRSTAVGSRSQTLVYFDAKADASSVASAMRNRLDQIKSRLPRDASTPLIAWHREPPT